MSSFAFDTHHAVKALREVGAAEPLAEAFVETIRANHVAQRQSSRHFSRQAKSLLIVAIMWSSSDRICEDAEPRIVHILSRE